MSIERHKKREHGTTREEGKGETMENQIEGEMIKDINDGQECDQWEKWQYDGSKPKRHKKKCDKSNRKRHRKKKRRPTSKIENKEEDKKNHETEKRCAECKKKCNSMEEIIKHIHGNECERCTCCEAHPRKQKENEERYTKEDECTLTIKEPDIAKGLTENN